MRQWVVTVMLVLFLSPLTAAAESVRDELKALKIRIEQLEKKLSEQDTKIEKQETVMLSMTAVLKNLRV